MTQDEIQATIKTYITKHLLRSGDADLKADTPLLEWGILNSMNIAKLMNFVRENIGVTVPPNAVTGKNFRDLDAIVSMVCALRAE